MESVSAHREGSKETVPIDGQVGDALLVRCDPAGPPDLAGVDADLGTMEARYEDLLLPLNGLLIAIFLGWVWKRQDALEACGLSASLGRLWRLSLRYVVPLLVLLVLAQSVLAT